MSTSSVPSFDATRPRYDQSNFFGRWRHFLNAIDPTTLFASRSQILKYKEQLKEFSKTGKLPAGATDADMWRARQVVEANCHPQTGDIILAPLRMSAFVPMNIPICAGLMIPNARAATVVFWQWINQSYSVCFNYSNANAASAMPMQEIMKAYGMATATSLAIALGLRQISLRYQLGSLLKMAIPYTAVAFAGAANIYMMRRQEITNGIDVKDANGNIVGISQKAGAAAVQQTILSRAFVLPSVPLLLPPLIMQALRKNVKIFQANKKVAFVTELAVITGCMWGFLPLAIAVFPQESEIPTKSLEERFHNMRDPAGNAITTLFFNKGL